MNKNYFELINIIGDLDRSVMYYATDSQNPNYRDCTFIQNLIKNYSNLVKIEPKISQFIDINYLKSDKDLPKVKAENLLMQSIRLQNFLGL